MKPASLAALLAVLGLAVLVGVLWTRNGDLAERVGALEEAAARPAPRAGAPAGGLPSEGVPRDGPDAPAFRTPAVSLAAFETLAKRVEQIDSRVLAATPGTDPSAADPESGDPRSDDEVRGAVERLLRDPEFRTRLAEALKDPALGKKPRVDDLAKALGLEDGQSKRFREDLGALQSDLYVVLSVEEDDGTTALAKIQAAEQLPEGDPRRAEAFVRLVQARIPGTTETYLQRAVTLSNAFRARLGEYLRADQVERLNRLDVDLFGVKLQ